jgi:large subunit ribosomal protein L21
MAETTVKKTVKKVAKKAAPKAAKKAPAKKEVKTMSEDFSVIETGGKQYIVSVGDVLEVELLEDKKEGDKVTFDQVLLSDNGKDVTVGTPYIKGAKVTATYLKEKKGPKITIVRYKAKSNRNRKQGHRQHYAQVKIESL